MAQDFTQMPSVAWAAHLEPKNINAHAATL